MALMSFGAISEFLEARTLGPRSAAAGATAPSRSYLLIMRFAILNVSIAAVLAAAWLQGWLDAMIASDEFHVVKIIALTFLVGLHQCGTRLVQLSRELDGLERGFPQAASRAGEYLGLVRGADAGSRGLLAATLRLKLATRLANIRYIANLLVLLGLIGTVVGFIIALSGISPSTAGDVTAVGPMVSGLLRGMAIALYTTLAGSLLNIWLMLNYRLLEHGTVHFYGRLVEVGEGR